MSSQIFKAEKKDLSSIRIFIKEYLNKTDIEESLQYQIILAVGEAIMNIVQHAYKGGNSLKKIQVRIELTNNIIIIELIDEGEKADPKKIKPRKLEEIRPGGLGTHFIKMVMDEVKWIEPDEGWVNHLVLKKKKN